MKDKNPTTQTLGFLKRSNDGDLSLSRSLTMPTIIKLLIPFLAASCIFGTYEYWLYHPESIQFLIPQFIFHRGQSTVFIKVSEVVFIIFLVSVYGWNNKLQTKKLYEHNITKPIFFLFLFVFFVYANPNNNFSDFNAMLNTTLALGIPFAAFFCYMKVNTSALLNVFHLLTKWLFIFGVLRAIYLIIVFINGEGSFFVYGVNATLSEGDTLSIYVLLHSLALVFFFHGKKRIDLFCAVLFFIAIFFSYRRSAVGRLVIVDSLTLLAIFILSPISFKGKIIFVTTFILMLFATTTVSTFIWSQFGEWLDRYLQILAFFNQKAQLFSTVEDHYFETMITSEYVFKNPSFWGVGIGNNLPFLSGLDLKNEYLSYMYHNAFTTLWIKYGFIPFIVYCLGGLIAIFIYFKTIIAKGRVFTSRESMRYYVILKSCMSANIIGLYITSTTGPIWISPLTKTIPFVLIYVLMLKIIGYSERR